MTAAIAMAATGCIITTEGDDAPPDDEATITAKWSIKNLASNDNTLPCPPSGDTTTIFAQAIDANGNAVGPTEMVSGECSSFEGAMTGLIPDVYQTWIELSHNNVVYAKSLSAIVDVVDVDKTFETTILEDGGYFMLDWTLRDATTAAELTCADAAAANVTVDVTLVGTNQLTGFDLPCAAGFGVTSGIVAGDYTASISVVDGSGEPITPGGQAAFNRVAEIEPQNAVTDLGHFDLPIE